MITTTLTSIVLLLLSLGLAARTIRSAQALRRSEALPIQPYLALGQTDTQRASAGNSTSPRLAQAPRWLGYRHFRITHIERENRSGSVRSFYLSAADGRALPCYQPGQYLPLRLQIPGHQQPLQCCYSLSDRPQLEGRHYRITVKRDANNQDGERDPNCAAADFLHSLNAGDSIEAAMPTGDFVLDGRSSLNDTLEGEIPPLALIAGGVGITPLLSMLNGVLASDNLRPVWLFYSTRDGNEHIMKAPLERLARRHPNLHLQVFYTQPNSDDQVMLDYDYRGRIDADIVQALLPHQAFDYYLSGPATMNQTLTDGLLEHGVAHTAIHSENHDEDPQQAPSPGPSAQPQAVVTGNSAALAPVTGPQ